MQNCYSQCQNLVQAKWEGVFRPNCNKLNAALFLSQWCFTTSASLLFPSWSFSILVFPQVCDHELQCQCEEGWAPPTCDSSSAVTSKCCMSTHGVDYHQLVYTRPTLTPVKQPQLALAVRLFLCKYCISRSLISVRLSVIKACVNDWRKLFFLLNNLLGVSITLEWWAFSFSVLR